MKEQLHKRKETTTDRNLITKIWDDYLNDVWNIFEITVALLSITISVFLWIDFDKETLLTTGTILITVQSLNFFKYLQGFSATGFLVESMKHIIKKSFFLLALIFWLTLFASITLHILIGTPWMIVGEGEGFEHCSMSNNP